MNPPLSVNPIGAERQVAEPVEQNAGETQVVMLDTSHTSLVY